MHPDFHAYLLYDPSTGNLTWKSGRRHAGRVAGCITTTMQGRSYRLVKVDGRLFYAHRIAWFMMTGSWPAHEVDHKNRNSLDNRWCNLRAATRAQNGQNKGLDKRNVTGFPGVSFNQRKQQFSASVQANRKRHFLGWYSTADAAACAVTTARRRLCGEFTPNI